MCVHTSWISYTRLLAQMDAGGRKCVQSFFIVLTQKAALFSLSNIFNFPQHDLCCPHFSRSHTSDAPMSIFYIRIFSHYFLYSKCLLYYLLFALQTSSYTRRPYTENARSRCHLVRRAKARKRNYKWSKFNVRESFKLNYASHILRSHSHHLIPAHFSFSFAKNVHFNFKSTSNFLCSFEHGKG